METIGAGLASMLGREKIARLPNQPIRRKAILVVKRRPTDLGDADIGGLKQLPFAIQVILRRGAHSTNPTAFAVRTPGPDIS